MIYSSSHCSTGLDSAGFVLLDNLDDNHFDYSYESFNLRLKYPWVVYRANHLTKGFLKFHSFPRFIQNGQVMYDELPFGVKSFSHDNLVFWKNVARAELIWMQIAQNKILQLDRRGLKVSDSMQTQKVFFNARAESHRSHFKLALKHSRTGLGLIREDIIPSLHKMFLNSLPNPHRPLSTNHRYLVRCVRAFDDFNCAPFKFNFTQLPISTEYSNLLHYMRFTFIEFVIPNAVRGNYHPAYLYRVAFQNTQCNLSYGLWFPRSFHRKAS